jgi:hypothetical protein
MSRSTTATRTVKQQVQDVLAELPDDCTMEEVQYRLYVADLIRRRVELSETEEGIPHSEIVKRFAPWRMQSSGSSKRRNTSKGSQTTSVPSRRRTPT